MARPSEVDALVGRNIRVYRVARGMTQAQLAERMTLAHPGWTESIVGFAERGRRGILAGELVDLANVLDTTPAKLLSQQVLS